MTNFSLPEFSNFQEAYASILSEVYHNGNQVNGSHELIHSGFTVLNTDNMIDTIRKPSTRYAISELIWYWKGSNKLDWINRFSTFWNHLSDDNQTCNSAYGYILQKKFGFSQIDKVEKELRKDKNSRRATIKINTPRTKEFGDIKDLSDTKDEFCTLSLQFLIRENKLHMIVNMRSNDLWKGLPYDAAYFVSIMDELIERLKDVYPELEKGTYTHFVGSIHVYDSDLDKVKKVLANNSIEPRHINIDMDKIRHNAEDLYKKIERSFYDKDKRMSFKEYKDSKRFEKIVEEEGLIIKGDDNE